MATTSATTAITWPKPGWPGFDVVVRTPDAVGSRSGVVVGAGWDVVGRVVSVGVRGGVGGVVGVAVGVLVVSSAPTSLDDVSPPELGDEDSSDPVEPPFDDSGEPPVSGSISA